MKNKNKAGQVKYFQLVLAYENSMELCHVCKLCKCKLQHLKLAPVDGPYNIQMQGFYWLGTSGGQIDF